MTAMHTSPVTDGHPHRANARTAHGPASRNDLVDRIDAEIIRLITRRASMARLAGEERATQGGIRFPHSGEITTSRRYAELGDDGVVIALAVMRLTRAARG